MLNIIEKDKAKDIWDGIILELDNPTFYQSYAYAVNYSDDIKFVYMKKDNKTLVAGFISITDTIKMPFGPIYSKEATVEDIIKFITLISDKYNKDVVFCVDDKQKTLLQKCNVDIIWTFSTPLIDTSKGINEVLKGCNQNRRRIIRKTFQHISDEDITAGREYIDEFYQLYCKRLSETKGVVDVNKDFLERILNYSSARLVVCTDKSKVIAGSIIYDFADTIITRYNCFDSSYSNISPIARIDYEMIKEACEREEIHFYDMSGICLDKDMSEKSFNVNRYKQSYGPKLMRNYQWVKYRKEK